MKKDNKQRRAEFLKLFTIFFILIAFVLTASMILFLTFLERDTGVLFSTQNIRLAALVTFGNVFLLSSFIATIDTFRRRISVERPLCSIAEGAEKVVAGDLSVQIAHVKAGDSDFNTVIDYFNRMIREISGMETMRTDFISNVSHELKTPLAVIQNYATMLQQPELSEEERREYTKTIISASRRLTNLITNILKLNKLENQQIYPVKKTFDLGEQLCECLLDFESAWEEKQLEIETDIADEVMVESDQELLSLVWNNLFSNAIKFTEPGGTVGLTLKTEGDCVVVSVSDTGCGISPEVQAHIFEKFYQGDTSRATQGNGLGLALAKRVVDIVDGEIAVESVPGEGSTFTVRLRRQM